MCYMFSDICLGRDLCVDLCVDLDAECSDLIDLLDTKRRKTLSACQSCLLREYFENKDSASMLIYELDERTVVFIRSSDLFLELRDDGGEAVPLSEVMDYLSDLEEFSLYPSDLIDSLRKWLLEEK